MRTKALLIKLLCYLFVPGVLGQVSDTIPVSGIEVIESRYLEGWREGAGVIRVIGQKEIASMPSESLSGLLEYALGTDVRKRGAADVQADLGFRAGSFDQTLVMINGIPVSDPQTGHHSLDIPFDLSLIDRIEILEGAALRRMGATALCGAINIITVQAPEKEVNIGVSGGMFGLIRGAVSAGYSRKKLSSVTAFSGSTSSGYRRNTDYTTASGFFSGSSMCNKGTLQFQFGTGYKNFGADNFYSARFPDQKEQTYAQFASLRWSGGGRFRYEPVISWRRYHDVFDLFRYETPAWYSGNNYHLTDVYRVAIRGQYGWKRTQLWISASWTRDEIRSSVLGLPVTDAIPDPFSSGHFRFRDQRDEWLLGLEPSWAGRRLSISGGFLLGFRSAFGWDINPGIDIGIKVLKNLSLSLSCARTSRVPTFTDLYYQGPANTGNPNLQPEHSVNTSLGARYVSAAINAGFSCFYRYGNDIIDWVRHPDSVRWQSANITLLRTTGIEGNIQLRFEPLGLKRFRGGFADVGFLWQNSQRNSGEMLSNYVMDYLKYKLILTVGGNIYRNTGFSIALSISRRNSEGMFAAAGDVNRPLPVCDLNLWWKPGIFHIFVQASNVFNIPVYDYGNVLLPGIWISGGVNCSLPLKKKKR